MVEFTRRVALRCPIVLLLLQREGAYQEDFVQRVGHVDGGHIALYRHSTPAAELRTAQPTA